MKYICFQMTRKAWLVLTLVLCLAFPALAQTHVVTGTVYEPEGDPAIGASVTLKGQTTGVATDIDGNYRIKRPPTASSYSPTSAASRRRWLSTAETPST